MQVQDIQTVIQVAAEQPLLDPIVQDVMRGRDDAHIDRDRLGSTQANDFFFLQDAQ